MVRGEPSFTSYMKLAQLEFNGQSFKRLYCTTLDEMATCCHKILESNAVRFGLDIETSKKFGYEDFVPVKRGNRIIGPCPGLCPLLSHIRLIQIYDPLKETVYVFDAGKIATWRNCANLRTVLEEKKFLAHNGVFEIKHFTHNGFYNMHVDCSMLLTILVDRAERSPFEPEEEDDDEPPDGLAKYKKTGYGLDATINRLYNIHIPKHFQTSNWNAGELSTEQINYAALDAVLTHRVGMEMMRKVSDYKMKEAYKVLRDMQHVVAEMELNGLAIDSKQHEKLIEEWSIKNAENVKECEKRFKKVNLNSSKQLNKWASEKYPEALLSKYWPVTKASSEEKRILSFGKDSLAEVTDTIQSVYGKPSSALKALLSYKTMAKLLSTYGKTLQSIIHPLTGRVHCSFILGETRTGRLSSREPNLQNLPRDENIRKLFIAPPSKHLLVADYSQLEIRAQAALSKDPVMTNAFMKGVDLHEYILDMAFGWNQKYLNKLSDDDRKKKRQLGKAINFGFAFGMGWKKFSKYALVSYGVKVTPEEAQKVYYTYHSLYRGYSNWCSKQRDICKQTNFSRTPLGKVRYLLPEEQFTRSVNTPVQGGAAEAAMLGLIEFRKMKHSGIKIVSTIHDENIIECSNSDPDTKKLLEKCMTLGFSKVFPRAPTNGLVEANFGSNWLEAKH